MRPPCGAGSVPPSPAAVRHERVRRPCRSRGGSGDVIFHGMARNPVPAPRGPVLSLCGWSGSGKTTLLREVIPRLVGRGLSVAALKHDAHGVQVDPRGKDSDQLFEAGADVVLRGPGQSLVRSHDGEGAPLPSVVTALLRCYDVVLVEGHKNTPLPKVWVQDSDASEPPADVDDVRLVLPWGEDRAERLERLLNAWLPGAWREAPVYAGVLVGGKSSRMGRPKQLLDWQGRGILERTVDVLGERAERVVLLGDGAVARSAETLPCLPDPPDLAGPLAGLLGALRWAPDATWIITACDQPLVDVEALDWLLDRRAPGVWAVLPSGEKGPEPLLALYDARCRTLLESMAASGVLAPREVAGHPRVSSPRLPEERRRAWQGVNTPAEYDALRGSNS